MFDESIYYYYHFLLLLNYIDLTAGITDYFADKNFTYKSP